ncbi:MAG: TIGR00282 family metallophosphoesterase [Clostridiales bacterium]|nr:TIGR00282 family metallophosphoesterase [Clostridiales bacterium]
MKVCFIGDVVAACGRRVIRDLLPGFILSRDIDVVICNAENAAHGLGCSEKIVNELISNGVNIITLGNHTFSNHDFLRQIKGLENVVRPSNLTPPWPGSDYTIIEKKGVRIGVINLLGQINMGMDPDSPFTKGEELINKLVNEEGCNSVIIDFHAETTSEKQALGYYFDGMATAVIGTHTHIQTADNRLLPNGTAYITDAGMTGAVDSVLGMDIETSLSRLAFKIPSRYEPAEGPGFMNGVIITLDDYGRATDISRFTEYE